MIFFLICIYGPISYNNDLFILAFQYQKLISSSTKRMIALRLRVYWIPLINISFYWYLEGEEKVDFTRMTYKYFIFKILNIHTKTLAISKVQHYSPVYIYVLV